MTSEEFQEYLKTPLSPEAQAFGEQFTAKCRIIFKDVNEGKETLEECTKRLLKDEKETK